MARTTSAPALSSEETASIASGAEGALTTVKFTTPCKQSLKILKATWGLPTLGMVIERLARERVKIVEVVLSDVEMLALSLNRGPRETVGEALKRIATEGGAFEMPQAVESKAEVVE